ncbi:hypothetical protein N7462_008453 [Penicillium macrosclerotiorum]|uniref:uncharacterized protein n=1 Tax=Penicillium macrosclerotiorum TaxID=303699 RepID=UPI0025495066|nr:uncharacterized protein N7462_008453 [Penicillium macrosclerotiorum]KAJ5675556.1 hypothetical protein N7462_008453 [Penicillium macrosclerotiorum]
MNSLAHGVVIPANHAAFAKCAVTGSLRHLFSRKERAKRKEPQQQLDPGPVPIPQPYKNYYHASNGPRSAYPHTRTLSSFAPDPSRQTVYPYPYQSRASTEHPPPYLPTYDPSKLSPIRPCLTPQTDRFSHPFTAIGSQPSSHLSAMQYPDPRHLSLHQQPPPVQPDPHAPPYMMMMMRPPAYDWRHTPMPFPPGVMTDQYPSSLTDGRERSISDPMPPRPAPEPDRQGSRRPKPVLSRLVTNFN